MSPKLRLRDINIADIYCNDNVTLSNNQSINQYLSENIKSNHHLCVSDMVY
jgi:hypothetical protein